MMGICLDTDANTAQDSQDPVAEWKGGGTRRASSIRSASNGMVMQNSSKIKFDPPKVPVIFILGGPGSGKVTHCDTLMQEKRGVTHINMMDLLQQYAIGNDMQDFAQIPSRTVAEVLMLEMKMAPAAKAFLISGYPRSMRDVVEYSEKIQVINGVIMISWRQSVLQKQIDYGAKLGHVVLSLAKMELENFFKNVMPVADYFDQSDLLVAVNGERSPSEVYKDFRAAVFDILEALENQEAIMNGVTGMGRGVNDIPGSIVSVETAPSQQKNITEMSHLTKQYSTPENTDPTSLMGQNIRSFHGDIGNDIPPVIWVIGGPGSNKGSLCAAAAAMNPGWTHFSVGRLLRTITDTAPRANTESYAVKEALSAGELVPEKAVNSLLQKHMGQKGDSKGIIIDGYPRKMEQVKYFETRFKQRPPIILLDCSKLQLGRGRIDDTVSSFRRRLELFREQTLPMLKALDGNNRLTIVDGDTDSPSVQREFEQVILNHIEQLTGDQPTTSTEIKRINSTVNKDVQKVETVVEDIEENVPGVVPTVSHHVSLTNGYLKNSTDAHSDHQKSQMNGNIANGGFNFRQMLHEAETHSLDTFL